MRRQGTPAARSRCSCEHRDFEVDGVMCWRTYSDHGATGLCVTNTAQDDAPAVSIYIHGGQVVGCIVRDGADGVVARWGLADAGMVE